MVNSNGNGKKIEVSLSKETNEPLVKYAEKQDKSVNSIVKESIEQHMDHCDTKSLLKKACESGDLREDNKVCKNIERQERE
ncbi:MAG: hypothetical protein WAK17_00185 [Candidatus Nitrosopolaris sp.]